MGLSSGLHRTTDLLQSGGGLCTLNSDRAFLLYRENLQRMG